jgi:hypothetical protein
MFINFIYEKWILVAIFRIETSIKIFKYNFHSLNYNFIVKHIFLNKTNNFKNSHLELQVQILIFKFK